MVKWARTTPGNRYTYAIFIDNDLIFSEWGRGIFSLPMRGGLQKIFEKHCINQTSSGV